MRFNSNEDTHSKHQQLDFHVQPKRGRFRGVNIEGTRPKDLLVAVIVGARPEDLLAREREVERLKRRRSAALVSW